MIDFYYWPTPNGHKVAIMLEEIALAYTLKPVDILAGAQFAPDFIALSPNNRIPAIVDHDGPKGTAYGVFESGAILIYLAEKTGQFWSPTVCERYDVLQWLMFQMANVGPMFGQNGYFQGYCPEHVPLAKARYHNECKRLYGVMDRRLAESEFLAGDNYSLADIATYPWTLPAQWALHRIDIDEYPHVLRWHTAIATRPAVQRGVALMAEDIKVGSPSAEAYRNMFGANQFKRG